MLINNLKGIGPKTLKLLNDNGIITTSDLISYYPFRYDIIKRSNIEELKNDDKIIIDGIVDSSVSVYFFNKKMNKLAFKINTSKYLLNVIIFNRAYLKPRLLTGSSITVIGKYDKIHSTIVASDIKFMRLKDTPIIEPIYHSIASLTSNQIKKIINSITEYEVIEYLPMYIKEKYKLIDKNTAVHKIHNPLNEYELRQALAYLKYEELFIFMLKMYGLKRNSNLSLGIKRDVRKELVDNFINNLPFKLTPDQLKCIFDIYTDLISEKRMNRLIQGDVGSGKTIVAIVALYINYLSGYQGALMAPTEVLAYQHLKNLVKMFNNYDIKIEILTSSISKKERKNILERLKNKDIDILIGTHALFSSDVTYNNLGLVITDEQHRFGVVQRSSLKNKGITPDILYLSATPIPRTYALTIYGDMSISNIKTMPSGRKNVKTILKNNSEIKEVLEIIYNELKCRHQIYVIAPLIEESDKNNLENVNKLEEKMKSAFGRICNIGVLHGKMTREEKDNIMEQFKNNEISILISTTVIEVGVDVENATVMVIFDAFRFGLSQLHQLRGRVGRNSLQSYCILISDQEADRLQIMTNTNDGFKISEEDFKLRGSGDIFGIRQSGDMNFKLANLTSDFNILLKAKEDVKELVDSNNIDNYNLLKDIINNCNNLD